MRRVFVVLLVLPLLLAGTPTSGQEAAQTFTWRTAGMVLQYPSSWLVGEYEGTPLLVSSEEGLASATAGEAPGTLAFGFYNYPQTNTLSPLAFLDALFPDVAVETNTFAGTTSFNAEFTDEATGQTIHAIAFLSPVTRNPHVLVAVAPQDQWASARPVVESVLSTARFLGGSAVFSFLGTNLLFQYPREWSADSNGQVFVAAPANPTAIRDGDLDAAEVFVRAQILAVEGIGIDPESENVAGQILEAFAGMPLETIDFTWGEDFPAVAAEFEFEDKMLLLVSVVV
ncbi:MAG: hypothetical protein L0154_06465, partial [Chloroflexi bacterium]|nr:hypothetical protein [Chloroflexota bacterium]